MDVPVSTLNGMLGMSVKMKKRRGKVGAGLPLEPWSTDDGTADSSATGFETAMLGSQAAPLLLPSQIMAATSGQAMAASSVAARMEEGIVTVLEEEDAVEALPEPYVERSEANIRDHEDGREQEDFSSTDRAQHVDMRCMKELPPVPVGE